MFLFVPVWTLVSCIWHGRLCPLHEDLSLLFKNQVKTSKKLQVGIEVFSIVTGKRIFCFLNCHYGFKKTGDIKCTIWKRNIF